MVDFQSYFVLILSCVIPTILIFKTYKSSPANTPHLPTPFRLPVIGHLHLPGPIIHQRFRKLSLKYGPVYRLFVMILYGLNLWEVLGSWNGLVYLIESLEEAEIKPLPPYVT
ncbi:hypothetical protein R6Q59_027943 [Mikania micrantha]